MRRRDFIKGVAGGAAAWPLAARAQQPSRVRRIGILMPYAKGDAEWAARDLAFKQELAKLGWTDGGNIAFDERWTTDNMDRVRAEAASLVASNPDIIVTTGGRVIPVFMRLTRTIPMVLPSASDPIGVGYAQSLARPGGNVTGFTGFELSILGKSLEILKQIAPAIVRVALIYNPDNPNSVVFGASPRRRPLRLPSSRSNSPFTALPISSALSRIWPIVATAAFSFCPTSRPARCATTSWTSWPAAACRPSIRSRSS
jgi:ABC transporter substrate binding protein